MAGALTSSGVHQSGPKPNAQFTVNSKGDRRIDATTVPAGDTDGTGRNLRVYDPSRHQFVPF